MKVHVAAAVLVLAAVGLAWAQPVERKPVVVKPGGAVQPAGPAKQAEKPTLTTPAQRDSKPAAPQKGAGQPEQQDLMASEPGPEHQRLAKLVGTFTTEVTFTGVGPEPVKSSGEAKLDMALGGRFLEMRETESMMGQPVETLKFWGFNNGTKKYESVWMYTGSTSMMTMTGEAKEDGAVALDASYADEMGKREQMKVEFKIANDDHFTVTLVGTAPTGEVKMVEAFTRKKQD